MYSLGLSEDPLTKFDLLVGAPAFWKAAAADIAGARRRVLVQAMTWEGDAAGLAVAEAVASSEAADRRVLVDDYSRLVISDRWVGGALEKLEPALRDELAATHAMFASLSAAGVGVRRTNPVGPALINYPARNHKKLIVADDAAYIGGINFSDHNFAWRDFMLRIEGAEVADWLAADFAATFSGAPRAGSITGPSLGLYSMDGRTNEIIFAGIAERIAGAKREITVISPYLTFPVTDVLAAAARRGVRVRLITPWASNKPTVRDYLFSVARKSGFEVTPLAEMIHLKGILVDEEQLMVGSTNFDFVSLAAEEEFLAVVTDAALIADFQARIVVPVLASAMPAGDCKVSPFAALKASVALRIAQSFALSRRGAPRSAVEWAS